MFHFKRIESRNAKPIFCDQEPWSISRGSSGEVLRILGIYSGSTAKKYHNQLMIWEESVTKLMLCIYQPRLKEM